MRASSAVAAEPEIEPSVPPTPMKPKSRFACPLRKPSAITDQNTDVTNTAYMLVHAKKRRPVHASPGEPASRARQTNQNAMRQATSAWYVTVMKRRTGSRATIAP